MLANLLTLVVYALVTVVALKLYFAARRKAKEARGSWRDRRWRRRLALLLFFAPAIAWLLSFVVPQPLMPLVDALRIFSRALDRIMAGILNVAGEGLGKVWAVLLAPIVSCLVYTGAGILVGWPIDYLNAKRGAAEGDLGAEAEPPAEATAPAGEGSNEL